MFDDFLYDNGHAKCHKNLVRMGTFVEIFDQATLHGNADQKHDGDGNNNGYGHGVIEDRGAEISEPVLNIGRTHFQRRSPGRCFGLVENNKFKTEQLVERHRAKGAKHKQSTMGKIDHTQCPEYERKTQCDQRVGSTLVQAVQKLKKDRIHIAKRPVVNAVFEQQVQYRHRVYCSGSLLC